MTTLETTRTCPYCGTRVTLGACPIVATNVRTLKNRKAPRSGTPVLRWAGRAGAGPETYWPVVAEAPVGGGAVGVLELPAVEEMALPEDLPARLCPRCCYPLPIEVDQRDVFTVAVLGSMQAGKSHYLASAIRSAYRLQGLSEFGITEFAPNEESANRYHQHLYTPAFQQKKPIGRTPVDQDVRYQPYLFRVTVRNAQGHSFPLTVALHDMAGEVLMDRSARALCTPFVRRADAVIFLVDPVFLPGLEDKLVSRNESVNQADLFVACMAEMGERANELPVRVVLSKSDLVSRTLSRKFNFATPAPEGRLAWEADQKIINAEVHDLLLELGAADLVGTADKLTNVRYQAVAAIGTDPVDGRLIDVRPQRCLDPLASVLLQLRPGVSARRAG